MKRIGALVASLKRKENVLFPLLRKGNPELLREMTEIEWLFNLQGYSRNDVKCVVDRIESLGLSYRYKVKSYDTSKGVPYAKIWEDTAQLSKYVDFYLNLNDDSYVVQANNGERPAKIVLEIIRYFDRHSDCGAVMMGELHFLKKEYIEKRDGNGHWWIGTGTFLRNLKSRKWCLYPHDVLGCPGLGEDMYAIYCRIAEGYFPARRMCVRTFKHRTNKEHRGEEVAKEIVKRDDSVLALIQRKWDPDWKPTFNINTKLPRGLRGRI